MRRTLEVLEGVRDGCGRLRRLLLVGRPELLVSSFGVQDALDGGGPQPLRAVEVEGGVVPVLDHEIAGLDFSGARFCNVLAVVGAVGHIAGFL